MPLVEIRRYDVVQTATEPQSSQNNLDKILATAIEIAKRVNGPAHIAVGTVEGQSSVQLILEWATGIENLPDDAQYKLLDSDLQKALGDPTLRLQKPVGDSIFGPGGPAEAPLVEFAHNQFPVSRVTPEFKARVKSDFQKFDDLFKTTAHGGENWVADWVPGQRPVDGQLTESFLVIRGYNTFEQYTASIQEQGFKDGLPILLEWKGQTTLVSFVPTSLSLSLTLF